MPRKGKGQKIETASGQTYGKRAEQEEAQKAIPLPTAPKMQPGGAGPLARPSDRPRQPLTTGAPVGPGAGPEVNARPPAVRAKEALSPRLLAALPLLEDLAALPGASAELRRIVRNTRGAVAAASPKPIGQ